MVTPSVDFKTPTQPDAVIEVGRAYYFVSLLYFKIGELMKRVALSKKVRFEVFKRDNFKCQYCGKSAPDVILNVDHLVPVKHGGNNDMLNLITSCLECNQGKKARKLDDKNYLIKQKKELDLLAEKRKQMEDMFKWKKKLLNVENDTVKKLLEKWTSLNGNQFSLNEVGQKKLKLLLKKFTVEEIIDAFEIAINTYYKNTDESINDAWYKVNGILYNRKIEKTNPELCQIKRIAGILKNKSNYKQFWQLQQSVKYYYDLGFDLDYLFDFAKSAYSYASFRDNLDEQLEDKI